MRRLPELALRSPAWTLVLLGAITAAIGSGALRLESDLGYRAFLGTDHPSVTAFDGFLERFGGGLPLRAVFSCDESPCTSALDPAALEMARDVGDELARSPAVSGIASPAHAVLFEPTPAGPVPRRLVQDGSVVADRERLAPIALADATWSGELVSPDARVGALVVDLVSSSGDVAREAYADLDAALAPFEARGWVFHRVGGPVEFVVAGGELDHAMTQIVPIMIALVAISLVLLFRSVLAASLVLATTGVAVLWAHGAMGWLGWPQNSLTQTLAPLVLVIGVCDGIHLVARYAARCRTGRVVDRLDRRRALESATAEVIRPCWMTSATTAAGFLSFVSADLTSFVQYGIVAASGVLAAFLVTFTLLPILLLRLPAARIHVPRASALWTRVLDRLVTISTHHRRSILASTAIALGGFGFGMTTLRIHSSFDELYGADSRVVRWSHFVSDHLRKPDSLEIDLSLPADSDLRADSTRGEIRALGDALASIPELENPRSLLDHPLGPLAIPAAGADTTPDTGLSRWFSSDRRHVRLSLEVDKLPQLVMRRVIDEARRRLDARLPPGWSAQMTGPLTLTHDMVEAINRTQVRSFASAAVAVALLLGLYLRSARLALLAMIPTLLPVVSTLGAMGLIGVPLDVGTAMVAAVVLGIAVDDVVHLLERFREQRDRGDPVDAAIHHAVREVGQAVVSTSLALSVGFGALALSPWASIAHFGLISAIAILAALVTDILVLPALVGLFARSEPHPYGLARHPLTRSRRPPILER